MSNTFCVSITHCKTDGDKATLGFVVANAAQGSEKETMVFLSSDGVYCAVPEEMAKINEGGPFAPLKDLVEKFLKAGGKIYVCTPCMKKRGITEAGPHRRGNSGRRRGPGRMAVQRLALRCLLNSREEDHRHDPGSHSNRSR